MQWIGSNNPVEVSLDDFAKMAIEDSYSQAKKYVQKQKNRVFCISGVVCETSHSGEEKTISMQKYQNPQIRLDFVFQLSLSVLQNIHKGDRVTVEGTLTECFEPTASADKAIAYAYDEEDFSGPRFIFRNCKICDGNGNKK